MTNIQIATDLHMHSIFSPDGRDTPEAMFLRGLELGLEAMAITEHAEWHKGDNGFPRVEEYYETMMVCKKNFLPLGMQVYTGVELGNPHSYSKDAYSLLDEYPFDIVIGSVHWLYGANIHDTEVFRGRDLNQVYKDYFEEMRRLCEDFPVDILAHFDRILWRANLLNLQFKPEQIENTIRSMLSTVAQRGIALELNSRHLAKSQVWRENLVTMLKWYKEEGGTGVVVNSDAHHTSHIALNFELAKAILMESGLSVMTPERLGEITFA